MDQNFFISHLAIILDDGDTVSNHSDSEILNITLNGITSSSHHQVIDRRRKIANIPLIDSIVLSKIDDGSPIDAGDAVDEIDTYETVRKASDISNISKFSYGKNHLYILDN